MLEAILIILLIAFFVSCAGIGAAIVKVVKGIFGVGKKLGNKANRWLDK